MIKALWFLTLTYDISKIKGGSPSVIWNITKMSLGPWSTIPENVNKIHS